MNRDEEVQVERAPQPISVRQDFISFCSCFYRFTTGGEITLPEKRRVQRFSVRLTVLATGLNTLKDALAYLNSNWICKKETSGVWCTFPILNVVLLTVAFCLVSGTNNIDR
jgi:hypothetical protein